MNLKLILFFKYTLLLFCCFGYSVIGATTLKQNPLDSIKQVMKILKIPYELQEEWIEDLEELEDDQDSPEFRELLADVDEEIKSYLTGETKNKPKPKKKKRFKDQINKIGKDIAQASKGIAQKAEQGAKSAEVIALLKLGDNARNKGNHRQAIEHYEEALDALEEQEKWEKYVEIKVKIADSKAFLKQYESALILLEEAKVKMRELGDGDGMRKVDIKIATLNKKLNNPPKTPDAPTPLEAPKVSSPRTNTNTKTTIPKVSVPSTSQLQRMEAELVAKEKALQQAASQETARVNAQMEQAKRQKDYSKIAKLEKQVRDSERKRNRDKAAIEKARAELTQEQLKLAQSEEQVAKQKLAQRNLYGGLGLLGLTVFSLFFLYRSKRKDHQKISVAYQELAVAQDELKKAETRIKGLLSQQVSGAVANELISGEGHNERRFVCVMFLDIRNFTPFVESKTPEEIIEYQNTVLGFMMEKVIENKGIINTILGDGFMATFGAPVSAGNDCLLAYKAAVEIMGKVKEKSRTGEIPPTKIGIGLHAGHVVAGNVGTKNRKQYLVTGNTVIIASRLEQLNKQYGSTLIISKEVVEQLPKAMNLPQVFDSVMVKGRRNPIQIAKYG